MKYCSICNKSIIKDTENVCESCGSKISNLNQLLDNKKDDSITKVQEKQEKNNVERDVTQNFDILINEDKYAKNRIILAIMILLLSLGVLLGVALENTRINYGGIHNNSNDLNKNNYVYYYLEGTNNDATINGNEDGAILGSEIYTNYKKIINNKESINSNNLINTNDNMLKQLYEACKSLLMNTENVEVISSKKDEVGNTVYEFIYDSQKFDGVFDKEKLLYITNAFNDKIFENGQVIKSVDSFLLPYDEMEEIVRISKSIVNLIHVEPTISRFPKLNDKSGDWKIYIKDNIVTVLSYVKYTNGGEIIRDDFEINLVKNGNGYKVHNIIYDGQKSYKLIY